MYFTLSAVLTPIMFENLLKKTREDAEICSSHSITAWIFPLLKFQFFITLTSIVFQFAC